MVTCKSEPAEVADFAERWADGGLDAQGRIEVTRASWGSRGARRCAGPREALENRGGALGLGDDCAHLKASAAGGAGFHVEVERSSEQGAPIHAGLRSIELAVAKSRPMG